MKETRSKKTVINRYCHRYGVLMAEQEKKRLKTMTRAELDAFLKQLPSHLID